MRNAPRLITLLIAVSAAAACRQDAGEQNIIIDNNVAANADIEALPADESAATPTDELVNGVDDNTAVENAAANSL